MSTGAQVEFVHGHPQEFNGIVIKLAMELEGFAAHTGIAADGRTFCETLILDSACGEHSFPDGAGRLAGMVAGEVSELDGGHFYMDVDAVQERSGNALPVTLNLNGRAAALPL